MPNTKSAKKRLRQNEANRARNRSTMSTVRTQVRKVRQAIAESNQEACEAEFRLAVQKLDKAAAKRIIHPNKAARTKSRLSAAIKAVKAAGDA
ncbi:MAG: 30S ribosomal protein S20 [Pirellulales bacterium]